jgi:lactate dehydrogenase-like 2-hydroxyacid dehydrogenase
MIEGRAKIVLTRRWPEAVERHMAELGEVVVNADDHPMSAGELTAALMEADILCPTVTDAMPAALFASDAIRTKLLANFGVGFNHIDMQAAQAAGIQVTNTPGVLTAATAEIALTLMMMSARRTGEGERHVRSGAWDGWRPTHMLSTQVTGKTLGLIGMGRIGTAFARTARHGLGMRIVYFNRHPVAQSVALELEAQYLPLEEVLARSDFVSVHCPSTEQTHHLLDRRKLALMQPHAHLINTARGDVIDEAALVEALQTGVIAGAGLDVYAAEPVLTPGLSELEQVVLLPHMGSGTAETREAMGMRALANVAAYLAGETLPDAVGNSG